ncbi:eukaryotic translation initiation factor 3subunit A, partial [Striga asiatica]
GPVGDVASTDQGLDGGCRLVVGGGRSVGGEWAGKKDVRRRAGNLGRGGGGPIEREAQRRAKLDGSMRDGESEFGSRRPNKLRGRFGPRWPNRELRGACGHGRDKRAKSHRALGSMVCRRSWTVDFAEPARGTEAENRLESGMDLLNSFVGQWVNIPITMELEDMSHLLQVPTRMTNELQPHTSDLKNKS